MGTRKVRAVVTTQFGCKERTEWYPEGSREAIDAMQALVGRQTDMFSLGWEEREDDESDWAGDRC
jgi:hypothetical protein